MRCIIIIYLITFKTFCLKLKELPYSGKPTIIFKNGKCWYNKNFSPSNQQHKINLITFKYVHHGPNFDIGNIKTTNCTRYLGQNIKRKLKFSEHISTVMKSISCGCYTTKIVSKELDFPLKKMINLFCYNITFEYGIHSGQVVIISSTVFLFYRSEL